MCGGKLGGRGLAGGLWRQRDAAVGITMVDARFFCGKKEILKKFLVLDLDIIKCAESST